MIPAKPRIIATIVVSWTPSNVRKSARVSLRTAANYRRISENPFSIFVSNPSILVSSRSIRFSSLIGIGR